MASQLFVIRLAPQFSISSPPQLILSTSFPEPLSVLAGANNTVFDQYPTQSIEIAPLLFQSRIQLGLGDIFFAPEQFANLLYHYHTFLFHSRFN